MCDCVNWYYAVVLICIAIFFQIVMYKIGYMQGEQSAYKRYTKTCNVCRNNCDINTYIDIIGSAIIVIELYVLFSMWRK